jgi:GNAT superfamily N-acetyltransferase
MDDTEIKQIVSIHQKTLGEDLLPQLGESFLRGFYHYVNQSGYEKIFTIKDDNKILATCIISYKSNTLMNRVIKNLFFQLLSAVSTKIFTNKKLYKYILKIIISKSYFESLSPEISYIFTNPEFQGKGIGHKMLITVEENLLNKNIKEYYVKTINVSTNKAIQFYKKNGFEYFDDFEYAGNSYLYLKKSLNV